MRKIQYVFIFSLLFILAGCENKRDMMLKTWKIESLETAEPLPADKKAWFDAMMKTMKDSTEFKFNADSTFTVSLGAMESNGRWALTEEATKLKLTYSDGQKTDVSDIIQLSNEKLILMTYDAGESYRTTLIPKP